MACGRGAEGVRSAAFAAAFAFLVGGFGRGGFGGAADFLVVGCEDVLGAVAGRIILISLSAPYGVVRGAFEGLDKQILDRLPGQIRGFVPAEPSESSSEMAAAMAVNFTSTSIAWS